MKNNPLQDLWKQQSTQNWPAYNRAQCMELNQFDVLLKDLLEGVEEPEYKFGRPTLPLRDLLFCSIKKVYSMMSCRRANGLFDNAEEDEIIEKSPHFTATSKVLNNPTITPILHRLITLTALPLKDLETQFAVDSTGFRTTRFTEYCIVKHGLSRKHKWLKCHAICGTKTNLITAVRITDENGADIKQFSPLVEETVQDFNVEEVSADKAYLSRENYKIVDKLGVEAFIPFKVNTTGKSKGSPIWHKMYHYFKFRQPEFMAHYHRRSNIESTFSMIKAKFGDSLKSKNRTAQENELLCKILSHNICVLIKESQDYSINLNMSISD
ncbi:MAG: transposase [Candidatus Aenigmarchaeota archaeon]|nr:transposase [Candidatus Aenigmarchaeota archaeon]